YGVAEFNGNTKRLDLNVRTDIEGENIPDGQYTAVMYTDLVNQLNITDLNGQLMKGSVSLAGTVGWADRVDWDLTGRRMGLIQNISEFHRWCKTFCHQVWTVILPLPVTWKMACI
ncbi:UNVERIFIED_CONTAM: hypothetical protein MX611_12955, partial [Staphylococcus haemolyticus]